MMSNSSLVNYTKISPNKNSPRNHKIDTITIHCYVGQASVESMGNWFAEKGANCSCNYGIGSDGRIALIVDEGDRSWCSSSSSNDNRAVTIECASDRTDPYAINDKVYASLIKLCADICKRNGIKELKWKADKSLIGQPDKQNLTVHRWFANKACPGDYIYNRLGQIAKEVNELLGKIEPVSENQNGLQARDLKELSESEVVEKVGPLFTSDQKKSGILASISAAQFILESGYGKTDLAQNANNCFGMKASLSGNTWSDSSWDGKSKYTKVTKECYDGKTYVDMKADFRKYPCIEDSIADHSAYLLGALNGNKKRYEGLKGCTDHKKAIQIIKDGGYATDPSYVTKILNIIDKWGLKKYDLDEKKNAEEKKEEPKTPVTDPISSDYPSTPFAVKVLIDGLNYRNKPSMDGEAIGQTGIGIFTIVKVTNGWGKLKSGAGWIYLGNKDYCNVLGTMPFKVKVEIPNLNIRTGPGKSYTPTGEFTGIGTFTITEVKDGPGSKDGWGKLKSGAGWISLDFAKNI